jgi:ubiquinone/menaquinone biosynthesis C-methylase UbiE
MDFLSTSIEEFYVDYIVSASKKNPDKVTQVISIGSGNCDLEVRLAKLVVQRDVINFRIDCLDLNPHMLQRGRMLAQSEGVRNFLGFIEADVNTWAVKTGYDVCIADQALHHVVDLEVLFDKVHSAIHPQGVFITSDMIGRNGHMRWPEVLTVIDDLWRQMPDRLKYNRQLLRFEKEFDNWDCSKEGFGGIRAQDILPLLIKKFHFEVFLAFGNLIDTFVDRSFGPNFDPENEEDRAFIDRLARMDDDMIEEGTWKPTHLIAAMRTVAAGSTKVYGHWTPEFCVRQPDHFETQRKQNEVKCFEINEKFQGLAQWEEFLEEHSYLRDPAYVESITQKIKKDGLVFEFLGEKALPDSIIIDGDNYRETIVYRSINSRLRATLGELKHAVCGRSIFDMSIFAPEAVTPFAMLLRGSFPRFIGSEYVKDMAQRQKLFPIPCEDLMNLSFPNAVFDIVLVNDVFEHVPDPAASLKELSRVLKREGVLLATFPFRVMSYETLTKARVSNGKIEYLTPAEYHENPLDPKGALVFKIPGWDILDTAKEEGFSRAWMAFRVSAREGIVAPGYGGVMVLHATK